MLKFIRIAGVGVAWLVSIGSFARLQGQTCPCCPGECSLTCNEECKSADLLRTCQRVKVGPDSGADEHPVHQGIAWGDDYFFSSRGDCVSGGFAETIFRYNSDWSNLKRHPVSYSGHLCHVGDLAVGPDDPDDSNDPYVYAPLSDFDPDVPLVPNGEGLEGWGATKFHIARWRTSDMQFSDYWDVTDLLGGRIPHFPRGGDLAGLAFYNESLYAVEWAKAGIEFTPQIFKLRVNGDELTLEDEYDIETTAANGIAIWNDAILITYGYGKKCGGIDVYDLPSLNGVSKPYDFVKYNVANPDEFEEFYHAEGLTVRGDDLWVCAGEGQWVRRVKMPRVKPVCRMSVTPAAECTEIYSQAPVTFNGNDSYDPNNRAVPLRYGWDFDQDRVVDDANAKTAWTFYCCGANVVKLTVTSDDGEYASTCRTEFYALQNSAPNCNAGEHVAGTYYGVACPTGSPCVSVVFNGNGSSDSDTGDGIATYDWDFGDGTPNGSGAKPQHAYQQPGSYTATLTVTDNRCAPKTCTARVSIGGVPVCMATTNVGGTVCGQPVTFDGTGSFDVDPALPPDPDGLPPTTGPVASYKWEYCVASADCSQAANWTTMGTTESLQFTFPTPPQQLCSSWHQSYQVRLTPEQA